MRFEIGQTWKTRTGDFARVVAVMNNDVWPVLTVFRSKTDGRELGMSYLSSGRFVKNDFESGYDLVELISEA